MAITPQSNATLERIADVIRAHDSFAICGHVGPDGDCLGSQLALMHALRQLGKQAWCLLVKDEPLSASLSFMPGAERMVPACSFDKDVQVFVGVDVPSRERIGESACKVLDNAETSITIDHHASDVAMCKHVFVDPDSPSASMIVWELVKLLCKEPPLESALCAYVGLMTDTGGFRFQNATADAFAAAADLVRYGADPAYAAMQAYQNRTEASLKLEAVAIDHMRVDEVRGFALSWLSQEDFATTGAAKSDAEPMINALRSLQGIRVACMLREQDGVVRGSLRAKDQTDVASLARELGGGGHTAAAGFTLECSLPEALDTMESKLQTLLSDVREA